MSQSTGVALQSSRAFCLVFSTLVPSPPPLLPLACCFSIISSPASLRRRVFWYPALRAGEAPPSVLWSGLDPRTVVFSLRPRPADSVRGCFFGGQGPGSWLATTAIRCCACWRSNWDSTHGACLWRQSSSCTVRTSKMPRQCS